MVIVIDECIPKVAPETGPGLGWKASSAAAYPGQLPA